MWKKQKHLKNIFLLLVFVFLGSGTAHAADIDYSLKTQYRLSKDYSVTIKKTLTANNNTNKATPSSLTIPVHGDPDNVKVRYLNSEGSPKATINQAGDIFIDNIKSFRGDSKKWGLVIEYSANLVSQMSSSRYIGFSPLQYDFELKEEFEVAVPLSIGSPGIRGRQPDKVSISLGSQIISWKSKSAINERLGVVFGEKANTLLTIEKDLENNSFWWQDIKLILPPENNQQSVYIKSLSPEPSSVSLDVDGNIIANYRIPPRSKQSVKAEVYVESKNQNYNLKKSSDAAPPQIIAERYLAREGVWSGGTVDFTTESSESVAKIRDLIKALNQVEVAEDSYQASLDLTHGAIGELREQNLPARLVIGKFFEQGTFQNRAWLEVYAPEIGWLSLDPLMQREGEHFGFTDSRYIALVMRGVEPDYPPVDLDNAALYYVEETFPEQQANPALSSTNYHIFPGISLLIARLDMAEGRVVDQSALTINQKSQPLGSLAPKQELAYKQLNFLGSAFASPQVSFESTYLNATAPTQQNYLFMILLLVGGVGAFTLQRYLNRRSAKKGDDKKALQLASEDSGDDVESKDLLADLRPVQSRPLVQEQPGQQTNPSRVDRMSRNQELPRRPMPRSNQARRLNLIQ